VAPIVVVATPVVVVAPAGLALATIPWLLTLRYNIAPSVVVVVVA